MNTRKTFLFIVLIFLSLNISAQKVKNKQFSLFEYNLDISKDIVEELASLESFVDNIKTYSDPGNEKLKAVMVHTIFYNLKDKLVERLEMEVLPVNTFMRNVKYDDYGYPNSNIREALRKGYSRFFFKVDVKLESILKKMRDENPEAFMNVDYPVVFPQFTIEITIYNNDGIIPADKWIGISSARNPLPINEYLLKGFDNTEMIVKPMGGNQSDNLYLILDRAIHNSIQDYLAR